MSDSAAVTSWDAVEAELVAPGIRRQTIHGERQTLVRYHYDPGAVFPVHLHPEEQITVVLDGWITFVISGESVTLGPGEVATIPGNVPHSARVTGNEAVDTLNMLSPRRASAPVLNPKGDQ